MKTKKYNKEEQELVKLCIKYLNENGFLVQRNNSGLIFIKKNNKVRAIKMGITGAPDIVGLTKDGRFIGIECKSKNGKISNKQKQIGDKIIENNGIYFIIRDINDLKKWVEEDYGKNKENHIQ